MITVYLRLARETDWMQVPQCCPESQKQTHLVQWLTKYLLTLIFLSRIQLFQLKSRLTRNDSQWHSLLFYSYLRCLGFYSWRNTTNGSWFVQALCYVLSDRGREDDLLSLMTTVSRIVSIGFESNTPQDSNMHRRKQIPCVTSLLTRKIYFKRKTTRRIWMKFYEIIALFFSHAYQWVSTIQVGHRAFSFLT